MSGAGAAVGIGLSILDRLAQAYGAGQQEDFARQLAERENTVAGTPSANQYQWSQGQDVNAPAAYKAPELGVNVPHSSFIQRLLYPQQTVRNASILAAIAAEDAKRVEDANAHALNKWQDYKIQAALKGVPQAITPEETARRAAQTEALQELTKNRKMGGNILGALGAQLGLPGVAPQAGPSPSGMTEIGSINPDTGAYTPAAGQPPPSGSELQGIQGALQRQVSGGGKGLNLPAGMAVHLGPLSITGQQTPEEKASQAGMNRKAVLGANREADLAAGGGIDKEQRAAIAKAHTDLDKQLANYDTAIGLAEDANTNNRVGKAALPIEALKAVISGSGKVGGMRATQAELGMLTNARSFPEGIEAFLSKATTGVPYSAQQIADIQSFIKTLGDRAKAEREAARAKMFIRLRNETDIPAARLGEFEPDISQIRDKALLERYQRSLQ